MATKEMAERMRDMSEDDLARIQATESGRPNAVLVKQEFERRARKAQHDLNLELLREQERWMKSATKFNAWTNVASALIGALTGASVGALLTFWLK